MMVRFLSALLVLGLLASANASNAYTPSGKLGCDYALSWKNTNFPDRSDGAEIVHSAAILYRDDAVGWLFQTRNSKMYYEDGPLNETYHKPASTEVATAVLGFLLPRYSKKDLQKGTLYPIPDQFHLDKLAGLNLEVRGCY